MNVHIKKEIKTIWRHFFWSIVLFSFATIFLYSFGPKYYNFSNLEELNTIALPSITATSSYVTLFFLHAKTDLLPTGIELISVDPITVLFIKLQIALLMGLFLAMPYFLYTFLKYITPALFPHEKVLLRFITILSSILFCSGIFFAYKFVIASMFNILLSFHSDIGIVQYLAADEFVSWTLSALFITGVMFLSPVIMYGLAVLRVVRYLFWCRYWRESLIVFLVIASVITPDVSGVSIFILMIPMAILYILGIGLSYMHESITE